MDRAPRRSCPNHHGPNGCACLPLQEHQHQQCQLPHPPATLPLHSLHSATTVFTGSRVHFPASQTATNSLNTSNDYHDYSRFHDFHEADYGDTILYSQPYDQSSNSQLHPPSQHLQFHFASPAEQNTGENATASNSGRKRKSSSAKIAQSRKRPRIPAVPTTEPPSLICGVGPPTTVENHSPPSTPVRLSSTTSHSVSASFQLPKHKRHSTEHSAAATDVWYFCRPQNSPTRPIERPAPDQDQLLTRRPKSKYISCKLCS
jgi:hypothetical protein